MRTIAFLVLVGVAAICGTALIWSRGGGALDANAVHRPIQVAEDGFVSSQACRACHPSQYESWHSSFHRTMTQIATPRSVRAPFDDQMVADTPGSAMRLHRRGAEFWAEFDDPDAPANAAAPQPRIERQIVMTTGSHEQQAYWYRTDRGRLLGLLPAMYLIGEQRWIPRAAAFLRPPADGVFSETGRWNGVCINCHATHGKWKFSPDIPSKLSDAASADTTTAEFGIACEACHGPGAEHVALNQNPLRRYALHLSGRPDLSMVQPARIDAGRSSEVCGQCHGVWNFANREEDEHVTNGSGFPYRAGDDLRKTRFVVQPTVDQQSPVARRILDRDPSLLRDSFWSDGMIRVSGREYNGLIESPCFKDAGAAKQLSCSSCHTMHKEPAPADSRSVETWAGTHQVAAGMDGNQACLQCHDNLRSNVTAHTKHQAGSSGSSCYNCHMPYTTYGLLRALRSHQISSPSVSASIQTGRPNACNLCHLDKTLTWTANALQSWYGTTPVGLGADEQSVSASLLWALKGDAGQRALVAWAMGWQPAQQTSGTDWMAPYLSGLLDDPYDAVRSVAYRSLRSLPGLSTLTYNFTATSPVRLASVASALELWQRSRTASGITRDPVLLFDHDGRLNADAITRLVAQRNDGRVSLRE